MLLTLKARIPSSYEEGFRQWQFKINQEIASFPGFISLEILNPYQNHTVYVDWLIVSRFDKVERAEAWLSSPVYKALIAELELHCGAENVRNEKDPETDLLSGGVTEVIVARIKPDNESLYRAWIAKLHLAESAFPGFRGVFVQAPEKGKGDDWITLLQFDTPSNLDQWLNSPERKSLLEESRGIINSLENHRIISPYAGWFSSLIDKGAKVPVWKQTMLVLLVLYPIIMLEMWYLNPWFTSWNLSFATFLGNAISVTLISWPFMPIAVAGLGWWLVPSKKDKHVTLKGLLVVLFLYLVEIVFFYSIS